MKILFSPSESKIKHGNFETINKNSFIFEELFEFRKIAINKFINYINKSNIEQLKKIFGIKEDNLIKELEQDIYKLPTMHAIQRYNGVSYEYLDFKNLNKKNQEYILNNTIIFSNLFGPILAKDLIPFYKFKQGEKIQDFNIEKFYKDNFSDALNKYLKSEEIIDLRATFYEKFYTIKQNFTTYKFFKNDKVVSHFAKAYRGILLKILAVNNIKTNDELLKNLPNNLKIKDIKIIKNKKEISLNIID